MSTIKVEDIAHVRFSAPDLEAMKAFLLDFGLTPIAHSDGELYARGAGARPFVHATSLGEPGFRGVGFQAKSLADLERLAAAQGAAVEPMHAPGGGHVVRLADPDGNSVEVVAGQSSVAPLLLPMEQPHNNARKKDRLSAPLRLQGGPAHVVRLGHAVLEVKDFRASEAWYKSHFGFITSDEIEIAPGIAIGAFFRCDRGDAPTDHHTLFLVQLPSAPRFNHAAFEVVDYDDLCAATRI